MAVPMSGHARIKMLVLLALVLEGVLGASLAGSSGDRNGPKFDYGGRDDGHEFITFNYGTGGVYKFAFKLRDQSRQEERNEEGEVRGSFSFIDPEGEEFSLKYLADKKGFQPEADHLPVAPEETDEVKEARKAFAEFYGETVKYLEALSSREGSDENGRSGSYDSRGGSRLGDVEGDDEGSEEDSSSESEEDGEASSEEDEGGDEDDSSEEGEDSEKEEDEEEGEEKEEEEEKEKEEKDKKSSDRKEGRKNASGKDARRSGGKRRN